MEIDIHLHHSRAVISMAVHKVIFVIIKTTVNLATGVFEKMKLSLSLLNRVSGINFQCQS